LDLLGGFWSGIGRRTWSRNGKRLICW